ncbi:MAG TPA: helix-turn-helix domain-containing protein [Prolixibacteraceae bacterium]|nr:helix-turn-helix domain-containing protein [Prolixibacteraceae bacterium]
MHYRFIHPSPILAPYVKHYWMLETEAWEGNVCERVVPTANLQLMFHYRRPFVMTFPDQQTALQPQSFASGLSSSFMDAATQGASGVIAIDFHSYGACNFFRFSLHEIENQSIRLSDIFTDEVKYLEEQICGCGDLESRISFIEKFLIEKLVPVDARDFRLMKHAVELVEQSGGQIKASQLAAKLAVTSKSLERKFASLVGKSPKQFIRIVRFQEVMDGLVNQRPQHLTAYAFNNGYSDQSHFIHEFKTFTGYTPREFVKLCPCREDWMEANRNSD